MFAQESVMDVEKEREAFEAYMAEKYKNLMDRRQCLNNGGGYMAWDMNVAWQVWQAKAQAVPEGFVLVPMVPSERMINAVRQCYEGEAYLPYSLYSEFVNQAIIERMEAQEPTND